MAKSIGGALLRGALGGIQAGAGAKALSLSEEAKQARTISLESLKQTGRMKVQAQGDEMALARQKQDQAFSVEQQGLQNEYSAEQQEEQNRYTEGRYAIGLKDKQELLQLNADIKAAESKLSREQQTKLTKLNISATAKNLFSKNMFALERTYAKGTLDANALSGRTRAELKLYKDKAEFITKQDQVTTDAKMAKMHEQPYYIETSPAVQNIMDISLEVNNSIDMNKIMGLNADGTSGGAEFNPPSSKGINQAYEVMMESPVFQDLPPFIRLSHAATMATQWANEGYKEGWGTESLADDKVADAVKAFLDGKTKPGDIAMLDLGSRVKFYEGVRIASETTSDQLGDLQDSQKQQSLIGNKAWSTLGGSGTEAYNINPDTTWEPQYLTEAGAKNAAYMEEQRAKKIAKEGALSGPTLIETR